MSAYGIFRYHIDDDTTDVLGIRRVLMGRRWQAPRSLMSMEELDAESPATPEMPGGVLLVGKQTRKVPGGMRSQWSFEGINGDGKSPTFKDRTSSLEYGFDGAFAQVSILKSSRWAELKEKYGGEVIDGEVIWPDTTPDVRSATGLPGPNGAAGKLNPMFGHTDYIRVEGTYNFRYVAFDLSGVTSGIAQIHSTGSLPGKAPFYPGRDWLKAPVIYRRRGPVFEITEIYWLSGDGGWPVPIYGRAGNTTSSSGLSSGGLQQGDGFTL